MNKSELVAMMATKANMTKKDSESALNALVESITESLKKGDKISLVGFGTFETRKRAARNGINPQTKKAIKIPATNAPAFKAGKALKDSVNNK
ncbi:MAG: HU family DNA-binding protein [Clostridiales bacterium]|nr:HU family DNA-binding protein [Clostridiales bacterium]